MNVLGVETSCDETSVAIVKDGKKILSNIISSSLPLHKRYGGVIPEIASRAHLESISFVTQEALSKAKLKLKDIDLFAVTRDPGLPGSLLVGNSFVKALNFSLKKPLVEVDHIKAHLYACFLEKNRPRLPFIGFVVSGGHTELFYVKNFSAFKRLGTTLDDAAGEAFDKVAKILKLGYPGGPIIDKLSRGIKTASIRFGCANIPNSFDFSFSGVKTAVLYFSRDKKKMRSTNVKEVSFSFQKSVVDVLVDKAINASLAKKTRTIVMGGGVVANSYLRKRISEEAKLNNIKVFYPSIGLCTDNAAMVAGLGYRLFTKK